MINPITKAKMTVKTDGRAIWNEHYELIYDNGIICGEGADINELIKKLSESAYALSATVFDSEERLGM